MLVCHDGPATACAASAAAAVDGGRVSETDIFLSYARQDRGTARLFADGLVAEGFTVWWDASLRSGETFDEGPAPAAEGIPAVRVSTAGE